MHYRRVARITRDHIRDHWTDYLPAAEQELAANDEVVSLPVPNRFDVASYLGGVAGVDPRQRKEFPVLSIMADQRILAPTNENFYTYRYDGKVTGMVVANDAHMAELMATGYLMAIEMFIADHQYLPAPNDLDKSTLPFTFFEFGFLRAELFGAAAIEPEPSKGKSTRIWIDGFSADIAWTISESGVGQHG